MDVAVPIMSTTSPCVPSLLSLLLPPLASGFPQTPWYLPAQVSVALTFPPNPLFPASLLDPSLLGAPLPPSRLHEMSSPLFSPWKKQKPQPSVQCSLPLVPVWFCFSPLHFHSLPCIPSATCLRSVSHPGNEIKGFVVLTATWSGLNNYLWNGLINAKLLNKMLARCIKKHGMTQLDFSQ